MTTTMVMMMTTTCLARTSGQIISDIDEETWAFLCWCTTNTTSVSNLFNG